MNFTDVQPEELTLPSQEAVPSPFQFEDVNPMGFEEASVEAQEAYQTPPQVEETEEDLRGPEGPRGPSGEDGHTPTDDELIELIIPLIPEAKDGKDGKTPTKKELLALIRPLIPKVRDGETPTDERLLALIAPLIPEPKDGKRGETGKDGSPDTGVEIVGKVNALEVEPEKQIDFKHIKNFPWHEVRRQQDGGLISWGGSTASFADNETPSGTIDGVNAVFTLTNEPSPADSLILHLNGQVQTQGVEYTLTGSTITFATAPDAAFSGLPFVAWYRY